MREKKGQEPGHDYNEHNKGLDVMSWAHVRKHCPTCEYQSHKAKKGIEQRRKYRKVKRLLEICQWFPGGLGQIIDVITPIVCECRDHGPPEKPNHEVPSMRNFVLGFSDLQLTEAPWYSGIRSFSNRERLRQEPRSSRDTAQIQSEVRYSCCTLIRKHIRGSS